MCFSAEASFAAAAVLTPAGGVSIYRAYTRDTRFLAISALPLLFGLQQFAEGMVWTSNQLSQDDWVQSYSMAYMFFAWLAWPIWVPLSAYSLEPCRRRFLFLILSVLGGMVGALQFFPYFAHEEWLVTTFLAKAISYEGVVLFDFMMPRELTNLLYLFVIIVPLITSSVKELKVFGLLIIVIVAIVYFFFQFAYVSAFCFGAAAMSFYIIHMIFRRTAFQHT